MKKCWDDFLFGLCFGCGFAIAAAVLRMIGAFLSRAGFAVAIAATLALPLAALAQVDLPPSIKTRADKLTAVTIKNVPPKVAWTFLPSDGVDVFREFDPDPKTIKLRFMTDTPGTYYLIVSSANGEVKQQVCVISVEGPRPPPPIPPDPPKPDPIPPPKSDTLSIVVVWESESSTPAIAGVIKDLAFWRSLEPLGVQWFQFDKDQPIVAKAGYASYVAKDGLPVILYMSRDGRVLRHGRLPATKEEIRTTVKELTGR